jgi:hypothetical protein
MEAPDKECFCESGVESVVIRYGVIDSGYVKCDDVLYGPFDKGNTFSIASPPSLAPPLPAMLQMNQVLLPELRSKWVHLVVVDVI